MPGLSVPGAPSIGGPGLHVPSAPSIGPGGGLSIPGSVANNVTYSTVAVTYGGVAVTYH
jgi:hypothetical protein